MFPLRVEAGDRRRLALKVVGEALDAVHHGTPEPLLRARQRLHRRDEVLAHDGLAVGPDRIRGYVELVRAAIRCRPRCEPGEDLARLAIGDRERVVDLAGDETGGVELGAVGHA